MTSATPVHHTSPQYAICVETGEYDEVSLRKRKVYRILPNDEDMEHGWLRVIDEEDQDYLYPAKWFVPIDVPHAVEEAFAVSA